MATEIDFPKYDELYVISDLHMGGGKPDFQILRETRRLAGFIRWVAEQQPGGQVALVLNGDVIDIPADGRTLQLHLSALYSDGSAVDVTELATWSVEVGFVAVSNTPGTKGLVSTVELGDDAVRAVWQGATARIAITVY